MYDSRIPVERRPNLFVPGVQKSGTTFFVNLLSQHPDIFVPADFKEPGFFMAETMKGLRFPDGSARIYSIDTVEKYSSIFSGGESARFRVDATTDYFLHAAPRRLAFDMSPDAKVIICLRNPVDRAYSAFNFYRQKGAEPLDAFEDALDAERERLLQGEFTWLPYLRTGLYYSPLTDWLNAAGHENVKIFLFDDFKTDLVRVMNETWKFLDVDSIEINPETTKNTSIVLKSSLKIWLRDQYLNSKGRNNAERRFVRKLLPPGKRQALKKKLNGLINRSSVEGLRPPELNRDIRLRLIDYYREDIEKTQGLLSRDLSSWLLT